MSIQLTNAETALAQACVSSFPALISTRATAPLPMQDAADGALRVALTDPVRALAQKLQQDHQQTTLATITAAFAPFYLTEMGAQNAAAQSDTARREYDHQMAVYGPSPISSARVALARFTGVIAANATAAASAADADSTTAANAAAAAPGNAALAAAATTAAATAATADAAAVAANAAYAAAASAIGES